MKDVIPLYLPVRRSKVPRGFRDNYTRMKQGHFCAQMQNYVRTEMKCFSLNSAEEKKQCLLLIDAFDFLTYQRPI